MMPIHELLSRIRWDKEFGMARFEIGYYDNVEQRTIRIPFSEMRFQNGNHFFFELESPSGETLTIPFHRVREVYRDGTLIWKRSA